ncbi:IclR family transcriptional regulator [Cnuibacter physcomitrellae]|uniref:IclR family transcriptional regulator domain-containing protein n=1 Tax=Cnuibacter physcomitrellae TaxID=1619308 RepID=UPI0012F4BC58|nr:IclR family transcriptional regulator C-terminal domain-containing protein [Cnuibacter physcomitrellae]GGI37868.1 IclR family transcriptional regulator [Cnuibacter physcomitrellae]
MPEARGPDFVEAIARGLEVITAFGTRGQSLSLADLSAATGLARPTVRRILLTLAELDYVRSEDGVFSLTPRVLDLGMAYVSASDIWELVRPRLVTLSEQTGESCSLAQLVGSDIVYVARAAVPKLVTLSVTIGTRFPAVATSLGKVLLASLGPAELDRVLDTPSQSGVVPTWQPSRDEVDAALREVRAAGWALTDQQLGPAIRSIAAPVRDGSGRAVAAVNVNVHAAETDLETLVERHLPRLLTTASEISADWVRWESRPLAVVS